MSKCNIPLEHAIQTLAQAYIDDGKISDKYLCEISLNGNKYRVELAVANGEITKEELFKKLKSLSPVYKKKVTKKGKKK